jgi:hypothetical protein
MSSTHRGAERRPADFYETPAWCVHRLLEALPLPKGLWFESCAGDGAIIKAVNEVRDDVTWHAHELREECELELHGIDFVAQVEIGDLLARSTFPKASVCITNPPFSIAKEMVEHLLRHGDFKYLIMLQRLNWCGAERADLFRELKPSVYVLPDRPSFTGGGADSIEYGWWVFDGEGKLRILDDTPDAVRREQKKRAAAKFVTPTPTVLPPTTPQRHILGTPHEHAYNRDGYCTVCQDVA